MAAQHARGHAQVVELGAGAGADVDDVDARVAILVHGAAVGGAVRRGDLRRERAGVEAVVREQRRAVVGPPGRGVDLRPRPPAAR